MFGDLVMEGEEKFRGLFGWGDAKPSVTGSLPVTPKTHDVPKRLTESSKVGGSSGSRSSKQPGNSGRPGASSASSDAKLKKMDELKFLKGFCEVKVFLKKICKNPSKASYWANKALDRHKWTERDLKQEGRTLDMSTGSKKRKRAGGVPEWMASKRALQRMCLDFF